MFKGFARAKTISVLDLRKFCSIETSGHVFCVRKCVECFCLNLYGCEVFVVFSTIYAKRTLSSALAMSENCKMNQ